MSRTRQQWITFDVLLNLMKNTNFSMVGVAGYVAPVHLEAIRSVGGELTSCHDISDSVGVLDKYFPNAKFFTSFERYERFLTASSSPNTDYLVVCSPNHVHDFHIRFGLSMRQNVICEKPLVLSPWNLDEIAKAEQASDKSVFPILQMRFHPLMAELISRKNVCAARPSVEVRYVSPRGNWYLNSWKGDEAKSGGVITNIGIHIFDVLIHVFGPCKTSEIVQSTQTSARGFLELRDADVTWLLSTDKRDLPTNSELSFLREISIDGFALDFSNGFNGLHSLCYEEILLGRGLSAEDARPAIELVWSLRNKARAKR